jgi:murein L,D-transpeptidase YcbB/YkuD
LRRPAFIAAAALAFASLSPALAAEPQAALSAADVSTLIDMLHGAEDQGFAPDAFDLAAIQSRLAAADAGARADGLERLEAAALAYARAQHGERIPAAMFPDNWAIRPEPYDARKDFDAALAQHRLAAWAAALPPPDPRYGRLVGAYARYRQIAAAGGWPAVPAGPTLKLGANDSRVAALRLRLALEDAALKPSSVPATFDPPLAEAVQRAQARYGLTPDGAAGASTLKALNTPVETRLGQMRANLERWRWVPRTLPAYRVELNIASQTLELYDGGAPALGMRAVVGQPDPRKQTPSFSDEIAAVVLNPPWNVPHDIAVKEIWPKIRRDAGYMRREGFVVRPNGELQQRPGPDCALGTIKFDLSNRFGVYLHDTPARSLFGRDSRAFSHGCMRLEQPNALAKRLLQGTPGWSDEQIDIAIVAGATQRIVLARPAPVFVFYWSVFVGDDGQIGFRSDLYGWDAKLNALLER